MLNHKRKTTVVIFGTIMFEEAKKMGLKNRDEMRRMSVEDQRQLQDLAAQRITEMKDDIVMIDTHLFINTDEGYYPGLPMRLLSIMKPTNMVMVAADPREIAARRKSDRKSTRLNSSHSQISYAVFCLKKKKKISVSAAVLRRGVGEP